MALFRKRVRIDEAAWEQVVGSLAVLRGLDAQELVRLRALAEGFARRRQFRYAEGTAPDAHTEALVAAQACLPILYLDLSWYSRWGTVLIVPRDYETEVTETDEAGVVHEGTDFASGEYAPLGLIVLSLPDLRESGAGTGYNVVIHEAAHVIDGRDGALDGAPPLPAGMDARRWATVFSKAYEDLQRRVSARARHARRSAFDPYAAEDPAEFFAVGCELFFERPTRLRSEYPDVYAELVRFFGQDPARRLGFGTGP